MKKINLILGNHNHQPVGNFGFVFEQAYNNAYMPFLEIFKKYPKIRFNFHYSGPLLDWLEGNRKEHLDEIAALVKDGRIEPVGGAYYEPILPSIPDSDKLLQMNKMNEYIEERFNYKPNGAWIAERVWEPTLVKPIADSNLSYIVVDDMHLFGAGVTQEEMLGYYSTDDEDKRINVFPISQQLRYLIPFRPVEKTIELLDSMASEDGDRLLVLHDDGEKYGDWPATYEHVYKDGWLKNFFEALERECSWINLTTYSDYMKEHAPLKRVYMPTASYEEMSEWVLPAKAQRSLHNLKSEFTEQGKEDEKVFLSGSFWRNFFVKYPESANMQKFTQYASKLAHSMEEGALKTKALDFVMQAQCNCAYWHGTFGGLYLNHLRYANYSNAIEALKIAEAALYGKGYKKLIEHDIDLDGLNECIASDERQTLIFHRKGGALYGWNLKFSPINLIDTLSRKEEAYHEQLLNEDAKNPHAQEAAEGEQLSIHEMEKKYDPDTKDYLSFDRAPRYALMDRILKSAVGAEDYAKLNYEELASFSQELYDVCAEEGGRRRLKLSATSAAFAIEKTVDFEEDGTLSVDCLIKNEGAEPADFVYAIENNFTLLAPDADDRYYFSSDGGKPEPLADGWKMNEYGSYKGKSLGALDEGYKMIAFEIECAEETDFLRLPCITVSDAVDRFEKVYQNSCITMLKELSLNAGEEFCFSFKMTVKDIS